MMGGSRGLLGGSALGPPRPGDRFVAWLGKFDPFEAIAISVHQAPKHIPQVDQQMKPVDDLHCLGSAFQNASGVLVGAVSGDNLDAGVFSEPFGQGLRRSIRQEIDRPVSLEIYHQGTVDSAFPESEIIDAEHGRCRLILERAPCEQSQQGIRAGRHSALGRHAGSFLAAEHVSYEVEHAGTALGTASIRSNHGRDPFGEDAALTLRVVTEEPADGQAKAHGTPANGQVGHRSLVGAVGARGASPAEGAGRSLLRATNDHDDGFRCEGQAFQRQAGRIRQDRSSVSHTCFDTVLGPERTNHQKRG
jgi:hypothetical protein